MPIVKLPFFVVPVPLGTVVTNNARLGHPVTHLGRFRDIGLTWKTAGSTGLWVRGNFGSVKPIDFCSIILANALAGTTVRLRLGTTQAEVDGTAPYDSTALPFLGTLSDDDAYPTEVPPYYRHSHLEIPSVVNARWWRIDIGGHTGDFEASALVLGKRDTPSRFYNRDFEFGIEDLGKVEFNRFLVANYEPGGIMRTVNFTMEWITEAELETLFRPMTEALGSSEMVYCCFDPAATTYRQAKSYFGVFRKPPFARGATKAHFYSQEFQILSLI